MVWSTHWQWHIFLHSMMCWRRRRYSAHVVRRRFRGHLPRCLTCLCSHRPPSCSCASGVSSPAWAFMFLSCSLKVSLCHFTNAVSCMSEKKWKNELSFTAFYSQKVHGLLNLVRQRLWCTMAHGSPHQKFTQSALPQQDSRPDVLVFILLVLTKTFLENVTTAFSIYRYTVFI